MANLGGSQGYDKERKMLDLASSQVFSGFTVGERHERNPKTQKPCCHLFNRNIEMEDSLNPEEQKEEKCEKKSEKS